MPRGIPERERSSGRRPGSASITRAIPFRRRTRVSYAPAARRVARVARLAAIQARALRWLEAGSQAVWIVDGRREVVHRLHRGTPPRILNSADLLEEPEVLPGFSVLVAELFARTL